MVTASSSGNNSGQGQIIASILSAMQNGVIAINNVTKTMKSIFPSSS